MYNASTRPPDAPLRKVGPPQARVSGAPSTATFVALPDLMQIACLVTGVRGRKAVYGTVSMNGFRATRIIVPLVIFVVVFHAEQ